MADDAGTPGPDLTLPADAAATGFFELLSRLESGTLRFGRAGLPSDEPARLGQFPRLSFATRDVARLAQNGDQGPVHVAVDVIGLLGPEGPMPLHLTRWVMARQSQRWFDAAAQETADTAFLDFCNLLQHRMIALYWRAWADARPTVRAARGDGGRLDAMLSALAGTGMPGAAKGPEAAATAALKVALATTLGHEVNAPERLTIFLARLLETRVTLTEFIGDWVTIPSALETRLGRRHARLGGDAVVGPRTFQRQLRAELRLGPLPLSRFVELIDSAPLRSRVAHAIRFVAGRELEFDLRLVLAADEVPEPRLGAGRLGRTLWLGGGRSKDRDDLRLTRFTGADGMERAA
jgi:type VI secretion system protein ImpH